MVPNTNNHGHVGSSHLRNNAPVWNNKASNPGRWTSITNTRPIRNLGQIQPMPKQYIKDVNARNAQHDQAKQYVQGVKDLTKRNADLIARQKASKAALLSKQQARRDRHQNIGRSAAQIKSSSNKNPVQNTRNNTNHSQATRIGGGGPPTGPSKLPANNNTQNFLFGIQGNPRPFQQLQQQLRASYFPKDIKQAIADRQESKLSPQDHSRYQSSLRRAVMNLASNPDAAHQIDRSFIEHALRGDREAITHTATRWEKADIAHMAERNSLLKEGKIYTAPQIKPEADCSYRELYRQFTNIKSVDDLKAVVANRAATNIAPADQERYQGALSAVLRGMAKNPDFAGELHEGFIDYALQGDRQAKQEIVAFRDKTLTSVLERRLGRL